MAMQEVGMKKQITVGCFYTPLDAPINGKETIKSAFKNDLLEKKYGWTIEGKPGDWSVDVPYITTARGERQYIHVGDLVYVDDEYHKAVIACGNCFR